jgi:hypothetical protein
MVNSPQFAKYAFGLAICPFDTVASAANIRSVQIARSTHAHWLGAVSVCLAIAGTMTDSLMRSYFLYLCVSTFLPPFPDAAFLFRAFQAAVHKV